MIIRLTFFGAGLFVLSSCSHFVKTNNFTGQGKISHKEFASSAVYRKLEARHKSSYGEIPLDTHPDVDKWLNYFTGQGREDMKIYLEKVLPLCSFNEISFAGK